jgi:DNA polymerase III epsilon subunit-like protein
VLVAVDVEAWERDTGRVTEVGVAIFSKGELRHRHFLVAEHLAMRNGRYSEDNRDHFLFGTSETLPLAKVAAEVSAELRSADFFIGHDVHNDVEWLREIGCDIDPRLENGVIDIQGVAHLRGLGRQRSLKDLVEACGLDPERLHNGGNDAAFTLQVLLSLAGREGWEPPCRRRSPHWRKAYFRAFEASARRKHCEKQRSLYEKRRAAAAAGFDI